MELQHIKPDSPKNTSLRELERAIEDAVTMGYDRIFCLIDMDNKRKDAKSLSDYQRLKNKYHGKKVSKPSKGISYEITFIETDRCTELFFLYYFRYTGQPYVESKDIESELARICGYEKSKQFFTTHPLHQYFREQGGSLADAISNSNKSIEKRRAWREGLYIFRNRKDVQGTGIAPMIHITKSIIRNHPAFSIKEAICLMKS